MILDTISEEFREGTPWDLMFADDLAVAAETEEEMQRRWIGWQNGMESKGLKVNTGKTEVMVSSLKGTTAAIKDNKGTTLKQVETFKYLGTTFNQKGGSEEAIRARVRAAWAKWREITGVINDKKIPRKLKIRLYETVIRPVLTYGAECWVMGRKEEQILETTEMRMLRRIYGASLKDKRRSREIRKELEVKDIIDKVREIRLRWFGHIQRMEEANPVRKTMEMVVEGRRPRGRPRRRWSEVIQGDLQALRVTPEDAHDRKFWKARTKAADPT